jgi:hypothetical protein
MDSPRRLETWARCRSATCRRSCRSTTPRTGRRLTIGGHTGKLRRARDPHSRELFRRGDVR